MIFQVNVCGQCHHAWMGEEYPERRPKCRTRAWDGQEKPGVGREIPAVITEYADADLTGVIEPARPIKELSAKMCTKHGQPLETCTGATCRIDRAERERRMA